LVHFEKAWEGEMKLLPLIAACALRLWSLLLLAFAGVILFAPASHAVLLAPNTSSLIPDNFTDTSATPYSSLTFVASNSGAINDPQTGDNINYAEAVYRTGTGFLDFMYQLQNTSTSSNTFVTLGSMSSFANFMTDVGYVTNGSALPSSPFINGTAAVAGGVERNLDGSTISFFFSNNTLVNGIRQNDTSVVLMIITDATLFDNNGTLAEAYNHIFSAGADFFQPTATPLPSALPLFAGGLGAMGLFGWRRKRKAQAAA
jgi:hypothetical protein